MKTTFLTSILFTVSLTIQFKFHLKAGERQCFGDQLPESMFLYGKVHSTSKDFKFDINEINGDLEKQLDVVEYAPDYDFHHVTEFDGQIVMCFEAMEFSSPFTIEFSYDAGGDAHDFDQIAKKGQANKMNASIHEMEQIQMDITREQVRLQETEAIRNLNYVDVSTKIIGFGGVTFAMLLIVAACQIIYVKRYFVYKKLI